MKELWKTGFLKRRTILLLLLVTGSLAVTAQQKDSTAKRNGGIFIEALKAIRRDTTRPDENAKFQKREELFAPFNGYLIRNIDIIRLPFGVSIKDTTKKNEGTLTRIANIMHHLTKVKTIENHLFFKESDTVNAYLIADNERFLRELVYLQDAEIKITPIDSSHSVNIAVIVKDVFSIGGAIGSLSPTRTYGQINIDNMSGGGNGIIIYGVYDNNRKNKVGVGGEILKRNIEGTFVDQRIGYQNNYSSILMAPKQENYLYYNLSKPLVNRFMNFTYEMDASYHKTSNQYNTDSIYKADFNYTYYQFEGWLGYNINGRKFTDRDESKKLRLLTGLRIINRKFTKTPEERGVKHEWQYTDLTGILGSFTLYRQNFVKTNYIYGFGRSEDIPVGLLFTGSMGYTIKNELSRPFMGIDFQKYEFLKNNNYLNYTLRAEGYLGASKLEDINLLASVNYFDRLKPLGSKWTQRFFLTFSAAKQINNILNEPLFLKSEFAIPEIGRELVGGDTRIRAGVESVFFSPWNVAGFKFAPLTFFNIASFRPYDSRSKLYSALGGGFRIRNESLIFGTIEIKGFYFPRKNFYNDSFGFDISTNIIFRYNNKFVKKPDFIQVN